MTPERYLKYLALKEIANTEDDYKINIKLANNTFVCIDIDKLKEDIARIQRDILKDYICE